MVCLLLTADLLGLMPNKERAQLQTRKVLTELLAVQVSDSIERGNLELDSQYFNAIRERYSEIVSLALRSADDTIIVDMGNHETHWKPVATKRSTSRFVKVPILRNNDVWANLEIVFNNGSQTVLGFFTSQKTIAVIILIGICGFVINWLFLRRALHELDPRSVVPDRVSSALNVLSEGLVMLDRGGRIVLCNTAFASKTAHDIEMLVGHRLSDMNWTQVETVDIKSEPLPWTTLLETGAVEQSRQLIFTSGVGEKTKFEVNSTSITSSDGVLKGVVITFDDVTELSNKNNVLERLVKDLKRSQSEISKKNHDLEILATRDPLTGSLNRRSLFEGVESLQSTNRENGDVLSCIMIDIDFFKSINDNHGHAVGDDVIIMVVAVIMDIVDSSCLVGRYGGEEFVVVLPGKSEAEAQKIAEKIRYTISIGSYATSYIPSNVTASFGVAMDDSGQMTPEALIDKADKGLYEAKNTGRNRVVRYSMLKDMASLINEDADISGTQQNIIGNSETADDLDAKVLDDQAAFIGNERLSEVNQNNLSEKMQTQGIGYGHSSDVVLMDRILQGIRRSTRQKTHVAVVFIAVDSLEVINNTVGSGEADRLVVDVSTRLKNLLRDTDTISMGDSINQSTLNISRIGVADLCVFLSDVRDAVSVTWILRRIAEEMRKSVSVGSRYVSLDAKMGVSIFPADGGDPGVLIANARQALREARKSKEHSSCVYFNKETNELATRALHLDSELRTAVERDEFALVYQPLVDLVSGRVSGFEALIRWDNAYHGLVSPEHFIPIAEQNGTINDIGKWVYKNAAFQVKQWVVAGYTDIYMSINVSAQQFKVPGLLEDISSVMDALELLPKYIQIEITETSLINDFENTAVIIEKLQMMGFRIALDDFGTGYSSLSYLKNFPINTVKIDKSYFTEFPDNLRDTSLIKAIISLGRSLGLTVIAEGVETIQQLDALMQMRCDGVQGYVFSKPLSVSDSADLLIDERSIRDKINMSRTDIFVGKRHKNNAINGVLNDIGPIDIEALSNFASRKARTDSGLAKHQRTQN